jgi:hypothetical protein
LEPVNPSDLRLSSIPQSRSSTGPHVRIRLGSKGGRGREKDEEKIAALLEASKLAKKSMQTLKESFEKESEKVSMRNHDLHKKLEEMARKERSASIELARAQERAYWEGRLSDEARIKSKDDAQKITEMRSNLESERIKAAVLDVELEDADKELSRRAKVSDGWKKIARKASSLVLAEKKAEELALAKLAAAREAAKLNAQESVQAQVQRRAEELQIARAEEMRRKAEVWATKEHEELKAAKAKTSQEEKAATEAVRKMDEMMAELKEAKAALAAARDEAKEARGREEAAVAQERADREALMEAARALGQAQARANVSQQAELAAQQAALDSAAALKSAMELQQKTAEAERVAEERAKVLDVLSDDRGDQIKKLKSDLRMARNESLSAREARNEAQTMARMAERESRRAERLRADAEERARAALADKEQALERAANSTTLAAAAFVQKREADLKFVFAAKAATEAKQSAEQFAAKLEAEEAELREAQALVSKQTIELDHSQRSLHDAEAQLNATLAAERDA